MLNSAETISLLPEHHSPNFFQKSIKNIKNITFKTVGIVSASAISVVTFYTPAYQAGASVAEWLKWPAIISGVGTNFFFNLQAYREFLEQFPKLLKMPWQFTATIFFSTLCVAPNLFMNIVDEEGDYIDESIMVLQIISCFLNIGVNIVGSMELINTFAALLKNKLVLQKEKLIEEMNLIIDQFSESHPYGPLNIQSQETLIALLTANNDLNSYQKISYYSLNFVIGVFSIPQFSAYLLISNFGMRNLFEEKFGTTTSTSVSLGLIAAIGNGTPGAGFSIKGINYISKKLIALEKPSLLSTLFILISLFSGFNTHKAMADSLKKLNYSGSAAELLKWSANLGAALIYNAAQMANLANSLSTRPMGNQLKKTKLHIKKCVENLDSASFPFFKQDLGEKMRNYLVPCAHETIDMNEYPHSYRSVNNGH